MQGTNSAYVVVRLLCKLTAMRGSSHSVISLFKIYVLLYTFPMKFLFINVPILIILS